MAWLLLALSWGCGDGGLNAPRGAAAQVDTVGGVIMVKNSARGSWDRDEGWEVEEIFRLGSVEGPQEELFGGALHSVTLDPDGGVYVLDFQAQEVRVFSGEGQYRRTIGRPGRGPAELHSAVAMGWAPDARLWVAKGFSGGYTVFDTAGAVLATHRREIQRAMRLQYPLVFLDDSSFIDETATSTSLVLLRVDTAGTVLDRYPELRYPERPAALLAQPLRPGSALREAAAFLPTLVWAVEPDGTVWLANSGEYRLILRTLAGDTLRVVEAVHRTPGLTPDQEAVVRRGLAEVGQEHLLDHFARPLIRGIHVLDDGHLLVRVASEDADDETEWDVFDPSGLFLGTLEAPFPMSRRGIPAFRGDTLVAVTLGDLDVPYVVKGVIRR